ncbi:hypothetical protein DWUX_117 [Desulfovibrio diazotrophicus]|nr:hypothetical protein DWUX_117 [Desulfovibrio diazotrophicus]
MRINILKNFATLTPAPDSQMRCAHTCAAYVCSCRRQNNFKMKLR